MREQTHVEWPEMTFKPIKSPGRPPIDRWQAKQLKNSGFSYREVARIMRVSPSAVYRAVKKL